MIGAGLRRAVSHGFGVDVSAALNLTGTLLKYLSLTAALPATVAVGYSESVWPFLAAGAIAALTGIVMEWLTRGHEHAGVREGFLVVSLTWLLAAGFGALPYLFSGEEQLAHPVDAYFEAMSGFTTTGATVLTDIPALDRSLLMWRQFTQWLGGMGIIVLAVAVLPRLRVGGRQLFESESPGPELEPLTASIRDTARRLWLVYFGLTAVLFVTLAGFGATGVDREMNAFDALAHAFTTVPTAGFSTRARSLDEFGAATQWTVALFMLLAGANFALLYAALIRRRPRSLGRDEEFRLYLALAAVASLILFVELVAEDLHAGESAVRHAVFQAISAMTTTGFASADFNEWTGLAAVTIVGLMFVGGSAGSTTGSVKVVRHVLIGRLLRRELDQTVHPEIVQPIRFNRVVVEERTLRAVIVFVLLYVGLFAVGALGIVMDAARTDVGLRPFDAIAVAASSLGNVGPAFGVAGPMGSYDPLSHVSKLIMIALMWLGRLEILPVIVLFTRAYWRA